MPELESDISFIEAVELENGQNIVLPVLKRSTSAEFESDLNQLAKFKFLKDIIDAYPDLVVILNSNFEIVMSNKEGFHTFKQKLLSDVLGNRFGEAMGCINSNKGTDGCGTSLLCPECGALKALISSISDVKSGIQESQIKTVSQGGEINLDFRIYTRQMQIGERQYVFLTAKEISDERRRLALERIFFHDVLNTSGAIHGIVNFLKDAESEEDRNELISALHEASSQLLDEIRTQKDLRNAENGNLSVDRTLVEVNKILSKVQDLYRNHDVAKGKQILVEKLPEEAFINTDPALLTRSIGNLVKNALEAVKKDGTIRLFAEEKDGSIIFNVWNEGVIPPYIQAHIFQRSFSTKGSTGRGIGTYSVKLLVENYLAGTVSFISNTEMNTVFSIRLPK